MPEPITTAGGVAASSCVAGVTVCTVMASVGLDVNSLFAALAGCVVVQTLLRSEEASARSIFLVTLGSIIFASFATPWFIPLMAKIAPDDMSHDHIQACTSALLASSPKAVLVAIQERFLKTIKGPSDAA